LKLINEKGLFYKESFCQSGWIFSPLLYRLSYQATNLLIKKAGEITGENILHAIAN